MDNARRESIRKSQQDDATFGYEEGVDLSKIDRFAAVAKLVEPSISLFLNTPETQEYIDTLREKRILDSFMIATIYGILKDTFNSDSFSHIHDKLAGHQRSRFESRTSWTPDYNDMLLAGASTFVNNTSNIFSLLERAYGAETAAHPNNWRIIDKLARMHAKHQAAYSQTYLSESINWTHSIEHFTQDTIRGGIKFSPGYPIRALVPESSIDPKRKMLSRDELLIRNNDTFISIESIETESETIGCPVTFQNQSLIRLWSLYAGARQQMSQYQ